MLREHDFHVPSVDTSEAISDEDSLTDFLDRVEANDRSLFTEGLDITLAKHPVRKPAGIVGQLYDAREGTHIAPVIDSLWSFQGAAPLEAVANRAGLFPDKVKEVVGDGISGILQITKAANLELQEPCNPNVAAILQGVEEGAIAPDKEIVYSRPLSDYYSEHKALAAD